MKISIITIVYNNAATIGSCLESVQQQSYQDIEHVVIDGGSTDGTLEIIEKYKDNIDVFVSEKDEGLYDALNKGIKKASGEVIGILHSDDLFYSENSISDVAAKMKQEDADLLYGNGIYVSRDDIESVKRIYTAKPYKRSFLDFGWIPLHTTIFVKAELFSKFGLYDKQYSIASDYDISIRWFLNPEIKKVFLDQYLVKMRLGGKSTTLKLQKKKSSQDLHIIKKHGLPGYVTLMFKIGRKIPQYLKRS